MGGAPGGAPGGAAPQPGLPPSLTSAPPGAGPVSPPQGNPGNSMAAMAKVKSALVLLQEALPAIPMGSDFHTDILKVVAMLAKSVPEQAAGSQQQIASLQALMSKLAQGQPNEALARMAQQTQPNAPPALPPQPGPPMGMAA